jgi:DNA modification methylase
LIRWRKKNPERVKEISKKCYKKRPDKARECNKKWKKNNPGVVNAQAAKRRAAQLQQTPKWANLEKIRDIYIEAARLTKETGIRHHVDHVLPLQGRNVCGLHIETNLQILTASENCSKSNKLLI